MYLIKARIINPRDRGLNTSYDKKGNPILNWDDVTIFTKDSVGSSLKDFIRKVYRESNDLGIPPSQYFRELVESIKVGFRKANKLDVENLAKIRKRLNVGWNSNVAHTKGKIGDNLIDLQSRSGKPKGTPKNFDNFDTIKPENYNYKNGPLNREFDSEQKQLEYLYNKYRNNKQISGRIEIVSDLKICPNCNYIIDKFVKDFPNIDVIRVWVRVELTR